MDRAISGLLGAKWAQNRASTSPRWCSRMRAEVCRPRRSLLSSSRASAASRRFEQVDIWADLPRSKVGKVLKKEIRAKVLAEQRSD